MSIESLMEKDDRDYERQQRREAERLARGEPEPVYVYKPPTPEQIEAWCQQMRPKRRRRRSTR
jgi:hypothetical protein